MRTILAGLFLVFSLMVIAPYNSFADMCGCKGNMGGDMAMMGEMGHHGRAMMEAGRGMWRHLKALGLDEKQKNAIKEIGSRVMKDTVRKGADLRVARIELREILDKDPVDMAAVEAKLRQMESLRTDLRLSHIKAMEEVKAQLTPEQLKKFREDIEKHRRWMHGGKGMTSPCWKKSRE